MPGVVPVWAEERIGAVQCESASTRPGGNNGADDRRTRGSRASHPPIGGIRELVTWWQNYRKLFLFPSSVSIHLLFISTDVKDSRAEDSAASIGASHIVFRDSGSSDDSGCGGRFRARRHNFR